MVEGTLFRGDQTELFELTIEIKLNATKHGSVILSEFFL